MQSLIIITVIISTFFAAFAQTLWKIASNQLTNKNFVLIFFNKYFIIGILIYAVAQVIYIFLLSLADLTYIHPVYSLNYFFALILSKLILHEHITKNRAFSVGLILIGITIISI